MKKLITLIVMISFVLASCGAHQVQTKTPSMLKYLKTKSIAPYETDIPVKTGALESLLKCRRMVK